MASDDQPVLTISVAAQLLGLHPRTLMLYERAKLILPFRTGTNRRMFSIKNLELLQFIKFMTQDEGVNLRGVKIFLDAEEVALRTGVNLREFLFPNFKTKALI
ncbi:MerR family transcriptional regulator [Candidatus Daviesbacteria bacterium]|nr:MerR family transcriptional regulator [Candidatus Daviesbacteria bacterium]